MNSPVGVSCSADGAGNTPAVNERTSTKVVAPDELREQQIEAAKQRMCEAPQREGKLLHWREMCRLIDGRSIHYVRFFGAHEGAGVKLASAKRFLQACRRGANADEMHVLITQVRRDERLCKDALAVARIARDIAEGTAIPTEDADEVAGLLARARYLMETA